MCLVMLRPVFVREGDTVVNIANDLFLGASGLTTPYQMPAIIVGGTYTTLEGRSTMSDEPIRLAFPVIRIPPNKGGGRGVFLWGNMPKGDPSDPIGARWVRSTIWSVNLANQGKSPLLQLQIPMVDLQEAFANEVSFVEVPNVGPAASAKLFNPNGSIIKKKDD